MQDKDAGKATVSTAAELCGVALNKLAEEAPNSASSAQASQKQMSNAFSLHMSLAQLYKYGKTLYNLVEEIPARPTV